MHFLTRDDIEDDKLYNEVMWQVASLGGDTDTNCCIVGSAIGAYLGLAKLPQDKVQKVLSVELTKGQQVARDPCMLPSRTGPDQIFKLLEIAPGELYITGDYSE
jgi:hypothetical protein